jgi:hypothetical protein
MDEQRPWRHGLGTCRRLGQSAPRAPASARLALAAALAVAAGAGCSGGGDQEPPAPLCPEVAIINGLESFERQGTDGSGELAYRVAMENIDGACRAEGEDLVVDIRIDLVAQPGPALASGTLELPYFVSVSRPDGEVIDRQDFVGRVAVPPGARSAGVTETFTQRFVGLAAGAADYQVLFGFALPEDEALRQRGAP